MRKIISLNNNWIFVKGFDKGSVNKLAEGKNISIPHTHELIPYNYADENAGMYESTYYKEIFLNSEDIKNKVIRLLFEGVAHIADVYCNGELMGSHKGGYTAFYVDITSAVKEGVNLIAVRVDSRANNIPPFGSGIDYLTYGGIYRDVSIVFTDGVYIKELLLHADGLSKTLNVKVKLNKSIEAKLYASVTNDNGRTVDTFEFSGIKEITGEKKLPDVKLWDTESPNLYQVTVSIKGEGFEDSITDKVGFLTAKFTPQGFLLNGKNVKLMGLNRHQSYPYIGYAAPKLLQNSDAELLKSLGCNIVRTSHYPMSRHFLNKCDELGLMVFMEVPGWHHIGDLSWQDTLLSNEYEMITFNYNHPSIVLWGVRINESEDNDALYQKTNAKAHETDPYRQTGGVRCIKESNLLEDVYTYNDFSHDGTNEGIDKVRDVIGKQQVPYLITEHNGHMFPTKSFDSEERLKEQCIRHLTVINAAMGDKSVCGAIGWCMSDYNTHKEFGSGDGICYHGVTDMYRNLKPAAYAYKSQGEEEPVLEVMGMNYGDNDKMLPQPIIVFSNCDEVKVYNNERPIANAVKSSKLKFLPHPPFVVENLVKEDAYKILKVSEGDGSKISKYMLSVMRNNLSTIDKLEIMRLSKKYNRTLPEWIKYAYSLIYRWNQNDSYRFVGLKKGKEVISKEVGYNTFPHIVVETNYSMVELSSSYEIIKATAKIVDGNGNLMHYNNSIVKVTVDNAEIIGKNELVFTGGYASVYIKLTKKGTVNVNFVSEFNEAGASIIVSGELSDELSPQKNIENNYIKQNKLPVLI